MHTLRVTWALLVMVFKRRLQYRGDLLVQSLDEALRGGLALVMLQVYVSRTREVGGWAADELLFIFGFAMVPIALFHCLCGNIYRLSSHYLIQGNFDRVLLRPMPTFIQVCGDRIAIEDLSGAVLGVAVMVYAVQQGATTDFTWWSLAMLLLLLLSALVIVMSVFMLFAASSFWFEDRVGMVPPVYNLLEFGRWPVGIFHPAIKLVITLIIPFSFTAFYPASMFLKTAADQPQLQALAAATPLVAMVILGVAIMVWSLGVRRYHSTGS